MLEHPLRAAIRRGVLPSVSFSSMTPRDPPQSWATVRLIEPSLTARWRSFKGPRGCCCCRGSAAGISSAAGACSSLVCRRQAVDFQNPPCSAALFFFQDWNVDPPSFGVLQRPPVTPYNALWDVSGNKGQRSTNQNRLRAFAQGLGETAKDRQQKRLFIFFYLQSNIQYN